MQYPARAPGARVLSSAIEARERRLARPPRRVRTAVFVGLACLAALLTAASSTSAQEGFSCGGKAATIVGTQGADTIRGSDRDDVIVTLGGDDDVKGGGGNDTICAGDGNDRVDGGGGNDVAATGTGNDRVIGGAGRDRLSGESGNDDIKGGGGADRLSGGSDRDRLAGGGGRDRLDGGTGFDSCGPASAPSREPGDVFGPAGPARACEIEAISLRRQSVLFDTMTWAVDAAVVSFESPSSFGDTARDPVFTSDRRLYVDLSVTSRRFQQVNYDQRHVFLRTADGALFGADGFVLSLSPGVTVEERISFVLPASRSVFGAEIVLGPSTSERATLPLSSPVPAERFPFAGSVESARKQMEMGPCNNAIDVQTLGARWTLDLPPEVTVLDIAAVESYRAAANSRFLVVDLRFFGLTNFCGGTNIQSVDMRIESDGTPSAVWSNHNDLIGAGTSLDVTAAFAVRESADEVTLLLGKFGRQIAEFAVVVPDLDR